MAEALRRFLWAIPLLGLLTAALFSLLTRLESTRGALKEPLFYNPAPKSAAIAAQAAVDDLLVGKPGARERLVVLGGAALPTIIGSLSVRPITQRRRIADALWPVAVRMGFSADDVWVAQAGRVFAEHETPTADEKLIFWERFAEEHATDLTPLSVQRLVKRVATRDAQLRKRELLAVDTFALPYLVDALGRVRDQEDVQRCRRLVGYVAHSSDQDFEIETDATIEEVRREVTRVRVFWDSEGPKWTEHSPFELLTARVVQTEYVKWLTRSIRELTRLDHSQLTDNLRQGSSISLPLLVASLAGLFLLGPFISSAIVVVLLSVTRYRLERFGLRLALTVALVSLTTWTVRKSEASFHEMVLLAVLTGAAFGTFVLQRELSDRLDWRTHHVLGTRGPLERVLAVGRWIAPAVPTLLPMALVEGVTWVICLESAAGLRGAGALSLKALLGGDLDYLMAFCMGLGVLTVGLQLVADLVLGDFDANQAGS